MVLRLRGWSACLSVFFVACSLVTDFPDKVPARDGEKDATVEELDARLPPDPTGEVRRDAQVADARRELTDGCVGDASCGQAVVECVVGSGKACDPNQVCADGGCGGCDVDAPNLAANGCTTSTAPICRQANGLTQCQPCTANQDCRLAEGQGYCVVQTGACTARCDPAAAPGSNGCASPSAAFCKPASGVPGGVDCAPCSASDCSNATFCATDGPRTGTCVGCRVDDDCAQNASAPLCDRATQQCRPRAMNDCQAPTPYLSSAGTCVACTQDRDCSANAPTCNTMTNRCEARCISDARCRDAHPETRRCNRAMTACVQCNVSAECPVLTTPLCSAGSCVRCTDYPGMPGAQNAACSAKTTRARCLRNGPNAGLCGQCDPTDDVIDCTDGSCNASTLVCE